MRIYVAGPYTAPTLEDIERNVARAREIGVFLIRLGHTPFVPHLSHYLDETAAQIPGGRIPYEEWMRQDLEWLRLCDALYVIAGSPGADLEVAAAHALGMAVYRNLDQVPRAREAAR